MSYLEEIGDSNATTHHMCAISTVQPAWMQELIESYNGDVEAQ